ncbi:MAG TPA: 4'-phosphopantetheinyl transferase superfamily protein [Silvibacterium sp.]|nr:4'-phosphopantetheinyl transferase superfamily protein [Silvibacterium sp.]
MNLLWPSATHPMDLAEDVHVWAWRTSGQTRDSDKTAILSPDERARMSRLRFAEDQHRYLVCHANLRVLLAGYCRSAPQEIAFEANEFGKPALREPAGFGTLRFNLSHSENMAILAVTRVGEIGADVEHIRPIEVDVAEAHFSKGELAELQTLAETEWLAGFFNCWTRKEAILKAEGCGLNLPLAGFDVSLIPQQRAVLREVRPGVKMRNDWQLQHLEPAAGFAAAIAVGGSFARVRCFGFIC